VWFIYLLLSHQGMLALVFFVVTALVGAWLYVRRIPVLWMTAACLLFLPLVIAAPKQAVRYYRFLSCAAIVGIASLIVESDKKTGV